MGVSQHYLLDGDVRLVEVLVRPFKGFLVEHFRLVVVFEVLVEVPLRVVHGPVVRVALLEGRNNLDCLLQHFQCAFIVFDHDQELGVHAVTFGVGWVEVPELFFSQLDRLLKVLVEPVNVTQKHLTAAPGFQQICHQRV